MGIEQLLLRDAEVYILDGPLTVCIEDRSHKTRGMFGIDGKGSVGVFDNDMCCSDTNKSALMNGLTKEPKMSPTATSERCSFILE